MCSVLRRFSQLRTRKLCILTGNNAEYPAHRPILISIIVSSSLAGYNKKRGEFCQMETGNWKLGYSLPSTPCVFSIATSLRNFLMAKRNPGCPKNTGRIFYRNEITIKKADTRKAYQPFSLQTSKNVVQNSHY